MSKFTCHCPDHNFRPIRKGMVIDSKVIESNDDAAKVFADRLARRQGKSYRSMVQLNSWCTYNKSSEYQAAIVAPNGSFKNVWLTVYEEAAS